MRKISLYLKKEYFHTWIAFCLVSLIHVQRHFSAWKKSFEFEFEISSGENKTVYNLCGYMVDFFLLATILLRV